ncbi:type 2 periplasmic-binding domain-containing protein [Streptomyces noursei]|uniref:hypothetical protein n=1 Tax=Streptomyces noursei TaxID=1971 RepID=UPI00380AC7AA
MADARHIVTSRRGRLHGPLDDALAALGLGRRAVVVAPTFAATLLMLANRHDVIGFFPWRQYRTNVRTLGLVTRELPFALPRWSSPWPGTHATKPTPPISGCVPASATPSRRSWNETTRPPMSDRTDRPRNDRSPAQPSPAPAGGAVLRGLVCGRWGGVRLGRRSR